MLPVDRYANEARHIEGFDNVLMERNMKIPVNRLSYILGVLAFCFHPATRVLADTLTAQETVLTTPYNLYSPDPLYDGGVYKLWYGGWATCNQCNDDIYYMTTTNLSFWPTPSTTPTINHSSLPHADHVNDPSVIKVGSSSYVMFFTAALNNIPGCTASFACGNTVWIATSTDGVSWGGYIQAPIPATDPSSAGSYDGTKNVYPFAPSAIYDSVTGGDSSVYKVFFTDYNDVGVIKVVELDANFNFVPTKVSGNYPVRNYKTNGAAQNVQVSRIGFQWYMWYGNGLGGITSGGHVDLNEVRSQGTFDNDFPLWNPNTDVTLIGNPPNPQGAYCATNSPGVLFTDDTHYQLFFSQVPSTPGTYTCDLSKNRSIQMWSYTLN